MSFTFFTVDNFQAQMREFRDIALAYGDPGQEIASGARISHDAPVEFITDPDDDTKIVSQFQVNETRTDITDRGYDQFKFARDQHALKEKLRDKHASALAVDLVSRCTSQQKAVLATKTGATGWEASKASHDTFRLFQLIVDVHSVGTNRMKQHYITEWFKVRQTGTFEEYLLLFNAGSSRVRSLWESADHPGFIKIDDLEQVLFLNGVHPEIFLPLLNKHLEEPKAGETLSTLQERFQVYNLSKGSPSPGILSFPGQALAAPVDSLALAASVGGGGKIPRNGYFGPRGSLGVHDPKSGKCPNCWSNGFVADHTTLEHPDHMAKLKKKKAAEAISKAPRALAAVVSEPPSGSSALPVAAANVTDPKEFIEQYERDLSKYHALMREHQPARYLKDYGGYVAAVDDPSVFDEVSTPVALVASLDAIRADVKALAEALLLSISDAAQTPSLVSIDQVAELQSAFAAHSATMSKWWYDNCATVTITNDLSILVEVKVLAKPIPIGGLGSGIFVTHSGYLSFMPRVFGLAYFSRDSKVNLISLGYIQQQGGGYRSLGRDKLEVLGLDGLLLDTATMARNRLPAASPEFLQAIRSASLPSILAAQSTVPDAVSVVDDVDAVAAVAFHCTECTVAYPAHLTAEQRARFDVVENLHQGVAAHASDDVLAASLRFGAHMWSKSTPADVYGNRRYRGLCPQCAEGKMHQKSMPSSETQPADSVGGHIQLDVAAYNERSPGGNRVAVRSTDEFSGDHLETPGQSKSSEHLYEAIMKFVRCRYNAHGHRVRHISADSEPSLIPVKAMLAVHGILLTLVSPGQYAQRMERMIQASDSQMRAVLAGLPFYFPAKFDVYLNIWIADCQNDQVNSRSYPSVPQVIVTGARRTPHFSHPHLSFGAVCMVTEHDDKRRAQAVKNLRTQKQEPKSELGVMLGHDALVPGDYSFLLSNGQIRPRRVLSVVQCTPPDGFAGFTWKKKTVLHAELSLSSTLPTPDYSLPDGASEQPNIQPDDLSRPRHILSYGPALSVVSQDIPLPRNPLDSILASSAETTAPLLSADVPFK